jgi:hypothetical protein
MGLLGCGYHSGHLDDERVKVRISKGVFMLAMRTIVFAVPMSERGDYIAWGGWSLSWPMRAWSLRASLLVDCNPHHLGYLPNQVYVDCT